VKKICKNRKEGKQSKGNFHWTIYTTTIDASEREKVDLKN